VRRGAKVIDEVKTKGRNKKAESNTRKIQLQVRKMTITKTASGGKKGKFRRKGERNRKKEKDRGGVFAQERWRRRRLD